jgi:hypothetical protein
MPGNIASVAPRVTLSRTSASAACTPSPTDGSSEATLVDGHCIWWKDQQAAPDEIYYLGQKETYMVVITVQRQQQCKGGPTCSPT